MKRDYSDGIEENVFFFVGKEVEHTPAFGMKTLFVVGLQPVEWIEEILDDPFTSVGGEIKHIFFGANHTFNCDYNHYDCWKSWEDMIIHFLQKGYLCSLDIPIRCVEEFNDGCLNEYSNFIPQIRVPIPYIKLWNYNTMVKIDDKGFNESNPGVWSHSLHDLMDRTKFTDWAQYKDDQILK